MNRSLPFLLGLGLLCLPQPAQAFIVFDPSNYAQNVLTAAHTLEQINNQILSLQNEAMVLQNMARNLQHLDYSSLGQITGALHRIDGLMMQAEGLSFDLEALDAQWEEQYPAGYDSSLRISDMAAAARVRWQGAMQGFQKAMRIQAQIVESVQADQSLLSELVTRSQGAEGAMQTQQAANQLIALSAKQQMQIQQLMAAQYRAQTQEAARKAQAEEAARIATEKFLGDADAYGED